MTICRVSGKALTKYYATKGPNWRLPPLSDERARPRSENRVGLKTLYKIRVSAICRAMALGRCLSAVGGVLVVYKQLALKTGRLTQHWNVEYTPDSECDNFLVV